MAPSNLRPPVVCGDDGERCQWQPSTMLELDDEPSHGIAHVLEVDSTMGGISEVVGE